MPCHQWVMPMCHHMNGPHHRHVSSHGFLPCITILNLPCVIIWLATMSLSCVTT
jgi:hypothetical protein